ncbi:MAG: HzsA-related protein [Planctomycetota bacterium]
MELRYGSTAARYFRISRTTAPDQDKVVLNLVQGENRLMLKIFNRANTSGFYFSLLHHASVDGLWPVIEQDFPIPSSWMRRNLPNGEHLKWFRNTDNTELERRMINNLLSGIGFAASDLRERFDILCRSDAAPDDPRWLGLFNELAVLQQKLAGLNQIDTTAMRSAIVYLAKNYPDWKDEASIYLKRLDGYEKRLLGAKIGLAHGKELESQQGKDITAEVASLQREALVTNHPLVDFDKLVFVRRYTYQSSHYYTDYIDGAVKYGGNLCTLSLKDGKVTELVPELEGGIFGRFDLSFDAKRVVFDYKAAPGRGYRIYEVGIDGKGLRQLTFDPPDEKERIEKYWLRWHKYYRHHTDDMHPCYLPDGRICFISTRCQRGILCDGPDILTSTVLYTMAPDGSNMEMISDGTVSEEVPSVMNDGRILYTRWEYVDKGGSAVKCLWAMRPDGSGSVEIFGNDHAFPSFYNGHAIPNSNNQFAVIGGPHMPYGVGTVIRLDINYPIRMRKPMTYITPEIDIQSEWGYRNMKDGKWVETRKGPLFDDPYPLSDKFFLVTYNPDKDVHDIKGYGLYMLDEFGNRVLIHRDQEMSCFQPVPLKPRQKPPVLPSVLPENTAKQQQQASVVMSDVYVGLDGVKRGTIKYLRVMEHVARPWASRRFWDGDVTGQQHSVITKRTHLGMKALIGIVPVNDDGSAYFTVPANKNIFFQALDENFMEVQRMRTFVDFKPGEKRSCIGCHEFRQLAPANKKVTALYSPPVKPGPQPGEIAPRTIYYPTDVQPILDKHCISCHSGEKPKAELDLTGEMTTLFSRSYESILEKKLVKVIDEIGPKMGNVDETPPYTWGSHVSRLVDQVRKGCPGNNTKLSREEFIKLVTWVDSNAQYYGSYYGRKNIKYKDHPNFRPIPTYGTAVCITPPLDDKER